MNNFEFKYKMVLESLKREQSKRRFILDWFCEEFTLDYQGEEITRLREHMKSKGFNDLLW